MSILVGEPKNKRAPLRGLIVLAAHDFLSGSRLLCRFFLVCSEKGGGLQGKSSWRSSMILGCQCKALYICLSISSVHLTPARLFQAHCLRFDLRPPQHCSLPARVASLRLEKGTLQRLPQIPAAQTTDIRKPEIRDGCPSFSFSEPPKVAVSMETTSKTTTWGIPVTLGLPIETSSGYNWLQCCPTEGCSATTGNLPASRVLSRALRRDRPHPMNPGLEMEA